MKKYLDLLNRNVIFQDLPREAILQALESQACQCKTYPAGKIIWEMGQPISYLGILLEGLVDIVHLSAAGHDTIVSRITPGGIFGESFSCSKGNNSFNEIRSVRPSVVLFLDIHGFLHQTSALADYQRKLVDNLLHALAQSNVWLNTKILILTQKTLRDKLFTYFETLAAQSNSQEFTLPFNREQLANFLGSERSSVSRELSRMQEDGLLTLQKDVVRLTDFQI